MATSVGRYATPKPSERLGLSSALRLNRWSDASASRPRYYGGPKRKRSRDQKKRSAPVPSVTDT